MLLLQLGAASSRLGWVVLWCGGSLSCSGCPHGLPTQDWVLPWSGRSQTRTAGLPCAHADPPAHPLTEILKGGVLIERNPELCFQETILWSDILHRHNEFRGEIQVETTRTRSCECPRGVVLPGRGLGVPGLLAPPAHTSPCAGPDCRALCAEGHCWGESKWDCQTRECGAHRGSDLLPRDPQSPWEPLSFPPYAPAPLIPTWHPNFCPRDSLDLLFALPNCCPTEPYLPPKFCSQRLSGLSICPPKSLSHCHLFAT